MSDSQTHLHSENFDLCRICLLEPESNRDIKFFHIFSPNNDGLVLSVTIAEFLGVIIDKDDVKPKIICQNCHKSLLGWVEMKNRAAESQIVINYIEKKRYAAVPRLTSTSGFSALPEAHQSSNMTDISTHSRNSIESSDSYYSITRSKSSILNKSQTKLSIHNNFSNSNSNTKNNRNQSISINQPTTSSTPIDDQISESDDDTSCQVVNVASEVICISDSEFSDESTQNNYKSDKLKYSEVVKLNYCSICRKKKNNNHDCSQYNKEFSTCLVPNCNIISRSTRDFTPHYRQHIGIPAGAVMCRHCYKENKKSERDENGHHINCNTTNLFKCYTCNVNFNNIAEFAFHKLKTHNGRLINSSGNYLCFYCENSSSDLMKINEHIKHCRKNQTETTTESNIKKNETENKILIDQIHTKNLIMPNTVKGETIPRSSKHFLFTCLKPSCNLIFQNFSVFKFHHRQHFAIGNDLMCWQCCTPFSNLNSLRAHQVKGGCRTPGMFKCFNCTQKYNDLQSLSIHKFTSHNGELISNKKCKRIKCVFCKSDISILDLKTHLINCQFKKDKNLTKKVFECENCSKVCLTAAALASHIKTHSNSLRNNSATMKRQSCKLVDNENEINTFNTSQSNEYMKSTDLDEKKINDIIKMDEEINTLPSTSYNHRFMKSDNNSIDSSIIEETDDEINLTSGTSVTNEIHRNLTTCIDGLFSCSKCPKKFHSKRGLTVHEGSHLAVKKKSRSLMRNYYCTKCKEYFDRPGFSKHWKLFHGKRLTSHKSKRYCCSICLSKFMYKMALVMHKEHKHSDIATNRTSLGSSIVLPKKSTFTSDETSLNNPIILSVKTEFTTDETSLDNPIMLSVKTEFTSDETSHNNPVELPLFIKSYSLTSEKGEDSMEIDLKICDEKTNTLSKIEDVQVDNVTNQKEKENDNEINETQDFNNERDNDNTNNTHEKFIQSENHVKKTDELTEEKMFEDNALIVNNKNDENQSSTCNDTLENIIQSENQVKKTDEVSEENMYKDNTIIVNNVVLNNKDDENRSSTCDNTLGNIQSENQVKKTDEVSQENMCEDNVIIVNNACVNNEDDENRSSSCDNTHENIQNENQVEKTDEISEEKLCDDNAIIVKNVGINNIDDENRTSTSEMILAEEQVTTLNINEKIINSIEEENENCVNKG